MVNDAVELSKHNKRQDSLQLSFVSKMYNLIDDKHYPIYDRMVANVFGINTAHEDYKNDKKSTAVIWYKLIIDVYEKLLTEDYIKNIITYFKEYFCCELTDMRILDIIVWQLGKAIEKEKQNK